ncbi:uncharacterized protein LOC125861624 [Solanum stenotomum]|uniref:uncharacterized protein LOC125861624 n=1 Tax=Solanum stenotomum TaxID=172797 RepID=UPI0020D02A03|nr:uncharacterized protein LOC125861624 [Solanum stenotomum]
MAAKLRFECTNNMAEYEACILGLKMAIDMNIHELLVIGDSDLLIHQVQGEWVVKNLKITPYVRYIQKLCKKFCKIEFRHTPRTHNELTNALAIIASMIKHPDTSYIDPVDIEVKEQPAHSWGMDIIGPIEPAASNRHRFILVVIDYFTKWVESASYKSVWSARIHHN